MADEVSFKYLENHSLTSPGNIQHILRDPLISGF